MGPTELLKETVPVGTAFPLVVIISAVSVMVDPGVAA
jgi:hypothetical protein